MIPMMGGLLISSIVSGQLVTRTGRYKIFPLIGSAIMAVAPLSDLHHDPRTTMS